MLYFRLQRTLPVYFAFNYSVHYTSFSITIYIILCFQLQRTLYFTFDYSVHHTLLSITAYIIYFPLDYSVRYTLLLDIVYIIFYFRSKCKFAANNVTFKDVFFSFPLSSEKKITMQ